RLALRPALDHPLARVVVFVGLLVAVVEQALDAILLVPDDRAPRAVLVVGPAGLIAVGIVAEGLLADVGRRVWLGAVVAVAEAVGGLMLRDRLARRLHDIVGLLLGGDVIDRIVGHAQAVAVGLIRRELIAAARAGQAIEVVVGVGLGGRPA